MSKRLDDLNKEYEKIKEIAGRKKAGYDSYTNVYEDSDENLFLLPPYSLALGAAVALGGEVFSESMDMLGMAEKETPSGRIRNKFEQVTATIFKNFFGGLGVAISTAGGFMFGLVVAALETPFALPKAIIEAPFIIRNRAYNRRIEKAKARVKKLENEICKEVQNPTKDEDYEAQKASKAKAVKSPVLTQSKENLKEESETR